MKNTTTSSGVTFPISKTFSKYVYSNVYLEVYCTTERRGFDLKSTFQLVLKTYKGKRIYYKIGKNTYYWVKKEQNNKCLLK